MNRQKLVLAVCFGLFVCSVIYAYFRMPRQKTIEKLKYLPGMTAQESRAQKSKDADGVRLRLDLLDSKKVRSFSSGKNIFYGIYAEAPKKSVLKLPLPPPPPPPPPILAAPVPAQPAVAEPTPMQREIASFTFLGFLKKDNKKTVFLSNGKEIFLVTKGGKIAGKYEVTALTEDALTISSVNDGGEILIPLVENKPLSAPRK